MKWMRNNGCAKIDEERKKDDGKRMMEKGVLDILVEHFLDEKLESAMKQDEKFMELSKRICEEGDKFESLGMDEEKRDAANRLISLHVDSIDFYAKTAYKQGFRDCMSLFKEIGMIEMPKLQGKSENL